MGFDESKWSDLKESLSTSDSLKASHVENGFELIEEFMNKGIGTEELKDAQPYTGSSSDPLNYEGWLDSDRIYKPEFYGSPSPRMMAVSGQTHFRETPDSWSDSVLMNADLVGNDDIPVPGACTSIKLRHNALVNVMCSFYCFEWGGLNRERNDLTSQDIASLHSGYEAREAGHVYLSVSGITRSSTKRTIFTSNVGPTDPDYSGTGARRENLANNGFILHPMIGRHQHFMSFQVELNEGVHDIGLVFNPNMQTDKNYRMHYRFSDTEEKYGFTDAETPYFPYRKHIIFKSRNMIVDAYYKDNLPE